MEWADRPFGQPKINQFHKHEGEKFSVMNKPRRHLYIYIGSLSFETQKTLTTLLRGKVRLLYQLNSIPTNHPTPM